MRCFLIMMLMFISLTPTQRASANIYKAFDSTGTKCASGGDGVMDMVPTDCRWDSSNANERASVLWGSGQTWVPKSGGPGRGAFYGFYVPFTGPYKVRAYFCPSTTRKTCTMSASTQVMDTVKSWYIDSATKIDSKNYDFGGYSGTLTTSSNACYALIDSEDNAWRDKNAYMCQDATILPDTPATCQINGDENLNVDMGTIERNEIPAEPMTQTTGAVEKTFKLSCVRDGGVNLSTTFQFTPITINGVELVSTTSANIGVAIFYRGKMMGPSSEPLEESFSSGETPLDMSFQVVRNPDVPLKDIPVGPFTASAVMVMTKQ